MFLRKLPQTSNNIYPSCVQGELYSKWASEQIKLIFSPIGCVQFDIAGTLVDPYCLAPFEPFKKIFSNKGITLTNKQLTDPMGIKKIDHIKYLLNEVREQWKNKFGQYPNDQHVDELHQEFIRLLNLTIGNYQQFTPGTKQMLDFLQKNNIPFALTSGYARPQALKATSLLRNFYHNIKLTTSEEVAGGRYAMLMENCRKLAINDSRIIFFTDACSDVKNVRDANNPSIIVVGVSDSSTHMGITDHRDILNLSKKELEVKQQHAAKLLKQSGAHAVISNMAEAILIYIAACKWIAGTPLKIEYPAEENIQSSNYTLK